MLEIFFQQAGTGTTLLSKKDQGEFLDVIGPLGKGFRLENALETKSAALIGGGRGIAPLYFLALELRDRGIPLRIYYGGKTVEDIPLRQKLEDENFDTHLSTDDGSWGFNGFVTDLFEDSIQEFCPSRIFACGPEAMMAKIAQIAREHDIYAEFSLESYMGCGFGACWGCVRKIRNGTKEEWMKICEEGPVFKAEQIIWQEDEEHL
jgi:dihydroorotate dehydrogenase electron transfer subunit